MIATLPIIARPTLYNCRTKKRRIRRIDLQHIIDNPSPYPFLVVPMGENKSVIHAFCVVDDLIFDSITPKALIISHEAVNWILNDKFQGIFAAYLFDHKETIPGNPKTDMEYTRKPTRHRT